MTNKGIGYKKERCGITANETTLNKKQNDTETTIGFQHISQFKKLSKS